MYQQIAGTTPEFRISWIKESIAKIGSEFKGGIFFDVGAGSSPYKDLVINLGLRYVSQDFGFYLASKSDPGMHTENWSYASHDYVCDVLAIPEHIEAEIVFCSEVLEHLPDPVAALKKIVSMTKPGGVIIISTPFISLMHQAPFWFQSGFSPFWFEHWSLMLDLEILELTVQGNYVDLVSQDFGRMMQGSLLNRMYLSILKRLQVFENSQRNLTTDVLSSGGCGTLAILRRK